MDAVYDKYQPEKCGSCGQSATYVLGIDRGTVDILKAVAVAIRKKGINAIHPRKEMEVSGRKPDYKEMVENGFLTSNQVGNLTRARAHGLIARIKGNPGNYCLTVKGAKFLRGERIAKYAIMSKTTKSQIGYWMPEAYNVSIGMFRPDQEYWEGMNYEIEEGKIVEIKQPKLL